MTTKNALLLAMLATVSISVQAESLMTSDQDVEAFVWFKMENGQPFAITGREKDNPAFIAEISMSKGGKQSMYFTVASDNYSCKDDSDFKEDPYTKDIQAEQVWKIGSKFVRMVAFCGDETFNATPKTRSGENYTTSLFKRAAGLVPIKVMAQGYTLNTEVSAVGFSKLWNEYGGNAL